MGQRAEQETVDRGGVRYGVALAVGLVATASPPGFAGVMAEPAVLVAGPLLALIGMQGIRSMPAFLATVFATAFVVTGMRDEVWFLERAWALVAGGSFAALTVAVPHWRLSSRALASVGLCVLAFALYLAPTAGGWAGVDWSIAGDIQAGYQNAIDGMALMRGGQPLDPAFVTSFLWLTDSTVHVYPARLGLQTMAALALAWWIYARVVRGGRSPVGPFRDFRFNDHLVWLLVVALGMIALRTGDDAARVGANVAVFMGGLYALRGLAVAIFVNGGLSWFGAGLIALGVFLLAPVVVGSALLVGIVDTWLDLRARVSAVAP